MRSRTLCVPVESLLTAKFGCCVYSGCRHSLCGSPTISLHVHSELGDIHHRFYNDLSSHFEIPPGNGSSPNYQHTSSNQDCRSSKHLCRQVTAPVTLDQCTRNWRTNQSTDSHNRKAHTVPRPHTAHILCQRSQYRRENTLESRNEKPITHRPSVQARFTVHQRPEEQNNRRHETEGDEHVVRPRVLVRKITRYKTAQDTNAIEHEQNVDTGRIWHAQHADGKTRDVVKRKILAQSNQENPKQEQTIRRLAKRAELKHRARFPRRQPRLQQRAVHRPHGQHHEPHDPDGPGKPNARHKLARDGRIHEAARGAAARHDGHRDAAIARKIRSHQGHGGRELQAAAQAGQEALREEKMPVRAAQTGHHGAQRGQQHPRNHDPVEVSGVEQAPGKHAQRKVAQHLHRADPGHGGRLEVQVVGVVGLEDAEGRDHAPGVEDDEVAHEGLGPGFEAAVGWGAGVDYGGIAAGGDGFGEVCEGVFGFWGVRGAGGGCGVGGYSGDFFRGRVWGCCGVCGIPGAIRCVIGYSLFDIVSCHGGGDGNPSMLPALAHQSFSVQSSVSKPQQKKIEVSTHPGVHPTNDESFTLQQQARPGRGG